MARTLNVYLDPTRLPERAAFQAAIQKLGFPLRLDEAWAPFSAPDYLPCTLAGEDAGVNLRFERDAALPEAAAALQPQQGARSALVGLSWSTDRREELAATILAAALVGSFDALALEPERGVRKSLSGLKAHARELYEGTF
ncbi:hypothetical protein BurJ1DRAFT_1038 [Burkholderiales bacterium JOSHI_001]|nr:hypothetical protein BurJ1DRAFT_1038 [Burkholderiales bacterium JOSHI_001]